MLGFEALSGVAAGSPGPIWWGDASGIAGFGPWTSSPPARQRFNFIAWSQVCNSLPGCWRAAKSAGTDCRCSHLPRKEQERAYARARDYADSLPRQRDSQHAVYGGSEGQFGATGVCAVGWLQPPKIPSDLIFVLRDASLADFALLTSAMHMAWPRHIGGRLESRYRYSIGLVYNTFPLPPKGAKPSKLGPLAQAVLDTRSAHSGATLADLYDPDLMPPNLRRTHRALDRAVDRLYRRAGFSSERERVEHLFLLHEKMSRSLAIVAQN